MVFKITSLFNQLQNIQMGSTDSSQEYKALTFLRQHGHISSAHINGRQQADPVFICELAS